jgi:hypothetical protein
VIEVLCKVAFNFRLKNDLLNNNIIGFYLSTNHIKSLLSAMNINELCIM